MQYLKYIVHICGNIIFITVVPLCSCLSL